MSFYPKKNELSEKEIERLIAYALRQMDLGIPPEYAYEAYPFKLAFLYARFRSVWNELLYVRELLLQVDPAQYENEHTFIQALYKQHNWTRYMDMSIWISGMYDVFMLSSYEGLVKRRKEMTMQRFVFALAFGGLNEIDHNVYPSDRGFVPQR